MRTRYRAGSVQADKPRRRWLFRWTERTEDGFVKRAKVIGSFDEFKTKTDASVAADQMRLREFTKQRTTGTSTTVRVVIEKFVAEKMPPRFSTRAGYTSYLNRYILPKWGETNIAEVKPYAVEQWLKGLPRAPKTKAHIKGLLSRLFDCAMLWEFLEIGKNPMSLVEVKGTTKRIRKPRILTQEEFQSLLTRIEVEPFRTMVLAAMCLGLRCSELLALKWSDFDWENLTLLVQRSIVAGRVDDVKTEYSSALVPLDPALGDVLLTWKRRTEFDRDTDWVWASPAQAGGRPYRSWGVQQRVIKPAGLRAGLGTIGWHSLRHSYRSWLDATGAPLGVQKDLMRHAAIATTMNVYGGAMTEDKRIANGKVVRMILPVSTLTAYPVGKTAT